MLTNAVFALEGLDACVTGKTLGQSWNGWAVPLFSLEEGERLVSLFSQANGMGRLSYDRVRDAFIFTDDSQEDVFTSADHKGDKRYAIGGFSWVWEDISDTPEGRMLLALQAEFDAMRAVGMSVPANALALACHEEHLADCLTMSVSEAADMLTDLARMVP